MRNNAARRELLPAPDRPTTPSLHPASAVKETWRRGWRWVRGGRGLIERGGGGGFVEMVGG